MGEGGRAAPNSPKSNRMLFTVRHGHGDSSWGEPLSPCDLFPGCVLYRIAGPSASQRLAGLESRKSALNRFFQIDLGVSGPYFSPIGTKNHQGGVTSDSQRLRRFLGAEPVGPCNSVLLDVLLCFGEVLPLNSGQADKHNVRPRITTMDLN